MLGLAITFLSKQVQGQINKALISYGLFYYNSRDNQWPHGIRYVDPACNIRIFLWNTKSFHCRYHYPLELHLYLGICPQNCLHEAKPFLDQLLVTMNNKAQLSSDTKSSNTSSINFRHVQSRVRFAGAILVSANNKNNKST